MNKICQICGKSFTTIKQGGTRVYCSNRCKDYAKNHSAKNKSYRLGWIAQNPVDYKSAWQREKSRRATDPNFKLAKNSKWRIIKALRQSRVNKTNTTSELLGCSVPFFRSWLESQWARGMNWGNWGTVWHIDHVCPLASFDLTDPHQQKRAFHYSNQRPLPAKDNLEKGCRITKHQPEMILCLS